MDAEPIAAIYDLDWRPTPEGELLFADADFEVYAGERVALGGPSGSGKTTLLRCLVALEPRESGTIFWRGDAVEPASVRTFRRDIFYLHQEPADIASGSVADNLAFARKMGADSREHLSEDRQRELLRQMHLGDLDWDRGFAELSVGERQRVAMVRAMTLQPSVFLLDEPTAALDTANVGVIEKLLLDYVERDSDDRALVWVSHDDQQAERVGTRDVDVTEL